MEAAAFNLKVTLETRTKERGLELREADRGAANKETPTEDVIMYKILYSETERSLGP